MRSGSCIALNVVVPGAGLVLARRERWGTALAFLFCAFGQVLLWGVWLTPASIPRSMTLLAAVGTAATWFTAQGLLWSYLSSRRGTDLRQERSALIELAS